MIKWSPEHSVNTQYVHCDIDALLHILSPPTHAPSSQAGKLDLTEVEGLADLLAAGTQAQHRQALLHATGAVRRRYEGWRARLLSALAAVEVRC